MLRSPSEKIDAAYAARSPLRILARLIDRRWWFYAASAVIFIIKNSGIWLLAIFVARLIDSLITPTSTNFPMLIALGASTAVAITLNIPAHTWFVVRLSECSRSLEVDLRIGVARRLQQLSIAYHQSSESGRLQAKLLRDVEQTALMAMELGHSGASAGIMLGFAIGYTAFTQPMMLGCFFLIGPVAIALARSFRGSIKARNQVYRERVESMNSRVVEMVDMLPLARAHGIEEVALHEFTQRVAEVHRNGRMLDRINAVFQSSAWVTFQIFSLAILVLGYGFVRRGWMTPGDLVLYQTMFAYLLSSVNQLLNLQPVIARGSESIRSLGEVLLSPDLEHNAGKNSPAGVRGRIELQDVQFTYRGASYPAIAKVNLVIEAGRTVAFVGESGSGKSTLIGLLIGFLRPSAGRILLDGTDMEMIDMRAWRRHLALVPQQIILFNGSLRDNILFGLGPVDEAWLERVIGLTHVSDFVDDLPDGLETIIGERGATLSGGQKQRIAMARALIRDPKVIVLDEPTSALDAQSERHVQAALEALTHGRTTIIVAHRLSTIRAADVVCVLDHGRLIESGSFDELLARDGPFAKLHAAAR